MHRLRTLAPWLLATATGTAFAHPGHAAAQWHWHATDTAGLLATVVLAGLAFWLARGD